MDSNTLYKNADTLKIGELAEATGMQTVTLRAWERRYGLLTPHRTPKGHRLYNRGDIKRVKMIRESIEKGISLPDIKRLLDGNEVSESASHQQQSIIALAQGLRQRALRQQLDTLFKERPLATLLDEQWPLVVNWPESAMKTACHALFCQELERQLTRFNWSRQTSKARLLLFGAMPLLFRKALIAVLSQHYLVMDLGDNISSREVQLASQVLETTTVLYSDSKQATKEWLRVGPYQRFREIENLLTGEPVSQ